MSSQAKGVLNRPSKCGPFSSGLCLGGEGSSTNRPLAMRALSTPVYRHLIVENWGLIAGCLKKGGVIEWVLFAAVERRAELRTEFRG
jgi:hypothetical protein